MNPPSLTRKQRMSTFMFSSNKTTSGNREPSNFGFSMETPILVSSTNLLLAGKKQNYIHQLKDGDGQWHDWDSSLDELIQNYFQNIFMATGAPCNEVLNAISPRVSNVQNTELLFPFTEDEIQESCSPCIPTNPRVQMA